MTREDKKYIKTVIDHFIDFYKFDLRSYNKAYRTLFDSGLHKEIIIDFLRRLNVPANVKLTKADTSTCERPHCKGYINLDTENPILFFKPEFKRVRFKIYIHPDRYKGFELFITTLCHELAHLVLHSTFNKYRKSEVATDLFIMAFGLYEEQKFMSETHIDSPGYISKKQTQYAYEYILRKQGLSQNLKKKTFISSILEKVFG